MRVLIIGTGAVAKVYGMHLLQGGAAVTFFAKPAHVEALGDSYLIHRLGWRARSADHVHGFDVLTEVGEVADREWDVVLLGISSAALRGDLAATTLRATGRATVVVLHLDLDNVQVVTGLVGPERVVCGEIPFLSYESPLPGEEGPVGLAYYRPRFGPTPLAGPDIPVTRLRGVLEAGGMPCRVMPDIERTTAITASVGYNLIAGAEAEEWDLARMRKGGRVGDATAAARQGLHISTTAAGRSAPPLLRLGLRPQLVGAVLWILPRVAPFPLEAFLRYHFDKIGSQTQDVLDGLIEQGLELDLPVDRLQALRARLPD
jgi:2-dehydropantoate 2-reductase